MNGFVKIFLILCLLFLQVDALGSDPCSFFSDSSTEETFTPIASCTVLKDARFGTHPHLDLISGSLCLGQLKSPMGELSYTLSGQLQNVHDANREIHGRSYISSHYKRVTENGIKKVIKFSVPEGASGRKPITWQTAKEDTTSISVSRYHRPSFYWKEGFEETITYQKNTQLLKYTFQFIRERIEWLNSKISGTNRRPPLTLLFQCEAISPQTLEELPEEGTPPWPSSSESKGDDNLNIIKQKI